MSFFFGNLPIKCVNLYSRFEFISLTKIDSPTTYDVSFIYHWLPVIYRSSKSNKITVLPGLRKWKNLAGEEISAGS